jgi:hypothetical protein
MLFIDASAAVLDLSIEFEGQTEAVLTATAASASSLVNGSTSALLFINAQPAKPSNDNRQFQVIYDALHYNLYKTTVQEVYNLISLTLKKQCFKWK